LVNLFKKKSSWNKIPQLGITNKEYEGHLEKEIGHFSKDRYQENFMEKKPSAADYLYKYFKEKKVKAKTGFTIAGHIVNTVNKNKNDNKKVRILSLATGPGGYDMFLAKNFCVNYHMDCIEVNEKLLNLGREKAKSENLSLSFIQQDINKLKLPHDEYDVIISHAALHHMINHEHISDQIKLAMKENSTFFVQETITRNGYRMWDESKKIANEIWSLIPNKFKNDNSDVKQKKRFFKELPDIDYSKTGFECIRSQDLYPVLKKTFKTKIEVPGFCFARRFFDTRFGGNYDVNNPTDKAIIDLIIKLDEQYSISHDLKPENIFLALEKNRESTNFKSQSNLEKLTRFIVPNRTVN